jgi:hypothetical protein
MRRCTKCRIVMVHGTHYETGKHNTYDECPRCHARFNYKNEVGYGQEGRREVKSHGTD